LRTRTKRCRSKGTSSNFGAADPRQVSGMALETIGARYNAHGEHVPPAPNRYLLVKGVIVPMNPELQTRFTGL
jgi:hypothetical protein